MPKKSNKTAHVLSLLTGGDPEMTDESLDSVEIEDESIPQVATLPESISHPLSSQSQASVQIQEASDSEGVADLVKSGLEKELQKQLNANVKASPSDRDNSELSERPPYSPTFMAKFGIASDETKIKEEKDMKKNKISKEEITNTAALETAASESIEATEQDLPTSLEQVKSQEYVLESFSDEGELLAVTAEVASVQSAEESVPDAALVLHNFTETVVEAKAKQIMATLNMCCCQGCFYDVMCLALNNMQPMYTVTKQGELFQKLTSYESQYGTQLASQITKACIKVKINPSSYCERKKNK